MIDRDQNIQDRIRELVDEEHDLRDSLDGSPATTQQRDRLDDLEADLDQCWDLLRRRRALREFGGHAEDAEVRPRSVVDRYLS